MTGHGGRWIPAACVGLAGLAVVPLQSGAPLAPNVVWSFPADGWGRPAADSSAAFFLTRRHEVVAIDAGSGALLWRQSTGMAGETTEGARVLLAPSVVIAGDDAIVGLDRHDGRVKWRSKPPGTYGLGRYLGTTSRTTVFAGSPVGRLYAINVQSGAIRWSANLDAEQPATVFEPVLEGDTVFAGFTLFDSPPSGGLLAVDAVNGQERWRATFDGVGVTWAGGPGVAGDVVVCAASTGRVLAFDRVSGASRWTLRQERGLPPRDFRPLAVSGRNLAAGSLSGEVDVYDLTSRTVRWRHPGPDGSVAFGIVQDGRAVYVPTMGGRLTALDVIDGHALWRTEPGQGRFTWPPAVAGDRVYASTTDTLLALEAPR